MRRIPGLVLLSLLSGCYLFSDEPKARKQPGDASKPGPAQAETLADEPPATPEDAVGDCPAFLTGVEAKPRTIASSCGPIRVRGQYRVDGGSLTLEPGVELRFEQGAVLEVGKDRPGVLTVAGTVEQPVRFVADYVGDEASWRGVRLYAQARGSTLTHVEIVRAGTETDAGLWIATEEVSIEGLKLTRAAGLALEVASEQGPSMLATTLSGTGVVAKLSPSAAAQLLDLTLEPTALVAITSGKIDTTMEWPALRYRIEGLIRIEGDADRRADLSVAAGASLHFTSQARIVVGGFGPGSLSASASPPGEPPGGAIQLRAAEDTRPGSWSGIHVQDQGELILRNVELAHGGSRDEGVVIAEGSARVTIEGCVFRDNLVGLELRGATAVVEGFTANEFINTPVALRTTPTLLAGIGADNRYDELAQIEVSRGKIEADATWIHHAAPIVIHGDLFVDKGATLTVAPGNRLGFEPGVVLGVGYYERASLDMRGTAQAPIVLAPTEGGRWGGVVLGTHARETRFEHVQIHATTNAAGVELRDAAEATLVNVDCTNCAHATVTWGCASKVGNIAVTASAGTPTAMSAPSPCN